MVQGLVAYRIVSAHYKRADGTEDNVEDWRGQSHSARKFISHQNPTVLEKRGMLAVSRQLSSNIMMRMFLLGK